MPEVKPPVPSIDPSRWILSSFYSLGKGMLGGPADIDDRLLVLPKAMEYMSTLPTRSVDLQTKVSKTIIELLHSKQRPPAEISTYSGHSVTRSVAKPNPLRDFPNPGKVFDSLLRSTDRVDHPNGISNTLIAFATILKLSISSSRSALSLSPLYGSNEDEENAVRLKDGSGMLSPDCYYEDCTLFLSPVVSALLILWNRNHNYIAHRLLENNEQKRWRDPSTLPSPIGDEPHPESTIQDDEIFKMARLINRQAFRNVVVEDFLKGLLGLANVGSSAGLDLFKESASNVEENGAEGRGRTSGVEFDLLYNWSAMASLSEVERAQKGMARLFPGKSVDAITLDDFEAAIETSRAEMNQDPRNHGIPGLRRGDDGRFSDNDIARVLQTATESIAAAPRGRGTASCMRVMEMIVMKQARDWNVCSLNEFRKFLGLKPFSTFKEWSSSPEIVTAAMDLYGEVDNLELYPGLQAEDGMPGSGFRMGYTMTYALLVDIVTSVRSAATLTAKELSEWGSQECTVKSNNGAFGAALPKIFLRNLPHNYPSDNVYGFFPFTLPTTVKDVLDPHVSKLYDWDKPRPRYIKSLETRSAISHVFNNPAVYSTTYGPRFKLLTNGYGFLLGMDNEKLHDEEQIMILSALLPDRGQLSKYARFFARTAEMILEKKGNHDIDIIGDVINATCASWVYQTICGPLLSRGSEKEVKVLEAETWGRLVDIHNFIFDNANAEDGWAVREKALAASKVLMGQIGDQLDAVLNTKSYEEGFMELVTRVYAELRQAQEVGKEKITPRGFLARLYKSSGAVGNLNSAFGSFRRVKMLNEFKDLKLQGSDEESFTERRVVANALGLSVMSSVSFAEVCANAVDFYLAEERHDERAKIIKLALANDPKDNPTVMGYIREAQRLQQSPGLFRVAEKDAVIPRGNGLDDINVTKGDLIFANFTKAHMNTADFPNPERVVCTRKTPSIQGMGLHKCPGISFVDETMPEIFKVIFRLKNLRRKGGRLVGRPAPLDMSRSM
ncbi:hypothetical protein PILCRDRAFT_665455 [Piloderma croceum F 1598]|uniref:Heme peroxidase n=1 Tax=Piloderma croceum (strain F 1598) TaxID=765440 RepID=A0A0C3F7C4_PILCF|nr:hypothetical protein PILCRDRAFT_665455 [Piloderma croceum F 1598]